MTITPPHSDMISQIMQAPLVDRQLVCQGPFSIVERVIFEGDTLRSMILKSIRPAQTNELRAHRLASSFPICAAPLVTSSETNISTGTPWLLMDEIPDQHNGTSWTPEQLTDVLVELAKLHRAFIQNPVSLEQAELLCCDSTWLKRVSAMLPEVFQQLNRDYSFSLPLNVRERLSQQVVALAIQAEQLPRTLVHGDFDPGNVVMVSEERIAALDWGLAHCNVPLVDVAHMVGRFDEATAWMMAVRYFETLDLPEFPLHPTEDILKFVALGDYLHQVFFLWWHSQAVLSGWAEIEVYGRAIWERSHALAVHTDVSQRAL